MAIGPQQREYMQKTLLTAIANFYGDRVPDLKTFIAQKRATFIKLLEEKVDAAGLRAVVAEFRELAGRAQAVVTRLEGEQAKAKAELEARHNLELAELKKKQEKERADLVLHYEPALFEARTKRDEANTAKNATERATYFVALGQQDDGRYVPKPAIDEALRVRVDEYAANNLMQDNDGAEVQTRLKQEKLMGDVVWLAKDMPDLRNLILGFIHAGKLPPVTVEAWLIENGKDLIE